MELWLYSRLHTQKLVVAIPETDEMNAENTMFHA